MSDKPIHMAEPLVLATLEGRKTVTRRPIRGVPSHAELVAVGARGQHPVSIPYAQFQVGGLYMPTVVAPYAPGDRLYVRERARVMASRMAPPRALVWLRYEADSADVGPLDVPARISIPKRGACLANGCYREACRLWLPVTEVRPERLHAMTDKDALLEGIGDHPDPDVGPRDRFRWLWSEIYGEANYCSNPWVWVIRWAKPEIRQVAA